MTAVAITPLTFAYAGLDPATEKVARSAVAHIKGLQQRIVTDIAEIGRTLLRVKEAVGHGGFPTSARPSIPRDWGPA